MTGRSDFAADTDGKSNDAAGPRSEPPSARSRGPRRSTPPGGIYVAPPPPIPGASLDTIERYAILKTLESVGWSTSQAASILGISVRKVQYRLHEYDDTYVQR